jgi:hypothetical protein
MHGREEGVHGTSAQFTGFRRGHASGGRDKHVAALESHGTWLLNTVLGEDMLSVDYLMYSVFGRLRHVPETWWGTWELAPR